MHSSFFTANRQRLIAQLKGRFFASPAHTQLHKSATQTYPFRQDSNFWYLTGIDVPDALLCIDAAGQPHLFIPKTTTHQTTWNDAGLSLGEAARISGVESVHYVDDKAQVLKPLLKKVKTVHMPLPEPFRYEKVTLNPAHTLTKRMFKRYGVQSLDDASDMMADLRSVKAPEEIELLRQATQVTEEVLAGVHKLIRPQAYEYELEAYIAAEFKRRNLGMGYDPIVASGPNAFLLHYQANNRQLQDNESILIDAGAQIGYYSADVTRMYEVGTMTTEYANAKRLVEQLQQFIVSQLKPGTTPLELSKLFRQELLNVLQTMQLLDSAATLTDTLPYCPHGYGHFLGLDVHDAGHYDQPFKPNMVFMVEPGLYIKEQGVAIRLEDAYLVTANGCVKLTEVVK